jgi:hypothetical protein
MEQYIPKSALVVEINKLYNGEIDTYTRDILGRLKFKINTLEVKEVDLDKNIKEEYLKRRCYYGKDNMLVILNEPQFNAIAKHFFELGMKMAQKGEEE